MPATPARSALADDPPVLLLTRPLAQSERYAAEALSRLGPLQVLIAPLMEIRPVPLRLEPAGFAGLIFTSENGVAQFCAQSRLRDRPVWCVGPRTAAAAAAAGFEVRSDGAGGGDAEALIRTLRAARPPLPLLHLRGEHAVTDLAGRLAAEGLACAEAVVYAQKAVPLPPEGEAVLGGQAPVLLPLFSPRSARAAGEAASAVREAAGRVAPLWPVAISAAAASRWRAGWTGPERPLAVASSPDAAGMTEALAGAMARLSA